ncbi:MAG: TonB-dependent receptor [Bacteroidales bacterium]|nr:TonB-dependent receptor [Bacteroidales bacterium]
MRLLVISLFLSIGVTLANHIYAQSTEISIHLSNEAISGILEAVEQQTEFTFIYDSKAVDIKRKVSVSADRRNIFDVLNQMFAGSDIAYTVINKKIILNREKDLLGTQQLVTVTGTVVDGFAEPIPGVNIVVKGTAHGVVTGVDGKYTISAPSANSILVFSFIGYVTQELVVGDQRTINITLVEETRQIEEVVVVGYGVQKKINLTGAISVVDQENLADRPLTNATQALQGVQGIYVNQAGGQPGNDAATIRIRGQGTLNNNNPLVLVDGIAYNLQNVNPNDIESISVLKDAASAAIYGSRAANGVILVTTKKGKKGDFMVEYSNNFGWQKTSYLPDFVYDPIVFMEQRNLAQLNEGKGLVDYTDAMIEEYREGMKVDPIVYPNNNWEKIMFKTGFIQEHNLRFSGGADKFLYSMSLGYMDQEGVFRGTAASKYSLSFNTTAHITDRLTVGGNVSGVFRTYEAPVRGVPQAIEMTFKAQAFHPAYLADGRYADVWVRTPGHNVYRHPLALTDEGEHHRQIQQALLSAFAEYRLPLDIKYKLNLGVNKYDFFRKLFVPDVYLYHVKTGAASKLDYQDASFVRHTRNEDEDNLHLTVYQTLVWTRSFDNTHNFDALFGMSYEDLEDRNFYARREGYLGDGLHELDAGSTNPGVGGTSSTSRLISYFGRINYNYREKYLLEGNFRYDGSSRFAKGNRWGFFPSFSAGWRLDRESFMTDIAWLNLLKVRASWGQLGNQEIALFRYVDLIDSGENYSFGGTVNGGVAVTSYNDPAITWETTSITNIGLDANLFRNRLGVVVEWFDKQTTDILRQVNLPGQVGNLNGPIRNIGEVSNKGLEIGLNYRHRGRDFNFDVGGSVTYVTNKVVKLAGQTQIDGRHIIKEGYPIDSYYLLHAVGLFQNDAEIAASPVQTAKTKPGYIRYQNMNDDHDISPADRVITGGVIPKYTYSFNINLKYRDFEVNSFWQGVQGVKTYASMIGAVPFWYGCGLPRKWLTDAWTPENPNAPLPILTTFEGSVDENFRDSDFWLLDASYLRMKNLQISYSVPEKFLSMFKIKKLKVFANGENLLTVSKMKDFDPEKNIKGGSYYEYPSIKIYSVGLNVTF